MEQLATGKKCGLAGENWDVARRIIYSSRDRDIPTYGGLATYISD